jgi:flagellar protein FlgJ
MTPILAASAYASSALAAPTKAPAATPAQRARVEKTAQAFEASFISSMLSPMFEGTDPQEPFGGGAGEGAFRSFMTDAMAKSIARHGGIGLARPVANEMLKLQGLS